MLSVHEFEYAHILKTNIQIYMNTMQHTRKIGKK